MQPIILLVAVVLFLVWRGTAPDDRRRLLGEAWERVRRAPGQWRGLAPAPDPFVESLRARTPRLVVTPSLVAIKVVVFVLMVIGPATTGDPDALLSWGASVGPQTSNGEWWRLLTALFASWGAVHLLADVAGLGAAGLLLERLVGPGAFAAMFVGAGLVSGAAGLAAHPVTVQAGASGAISGLYGLLATLAVWGWLRPSPATIPLTSLKRIWPGVALFIVYVVLAEGLGSESLRLGFVSGIGGGLVLATGLGLQTPRPRQVATVAGLAVLAVVVLAVPVRGMADVAAEVRFVADVEHRTSAVYGDAVERFRRGRVDAAGLRAVIEESVLPDIQDARARVGAVDRVPTAQQALVDGAAAYLRLREQSWRVRVEGLGQGDFTTFAEADRLAQEARLELDAITGAVGIVE